MSTASDATVLAKVTVDSTLKDKAGNALTNQTISATYQKQGSTTIDQFGSGKTGADGKTSISKSIARGTYKFVVKFTKDAKYNESTASETKAVV